MYAEIDGNTVSLEEITLDDFGWDKPTAYGPRSLFLHITEHELAKVGKVLWEYARQCEIDEPGFFSGEFRQEIPVPSSERIFVENPALLCKYLNDSFWSRETIISILNCIEEVEIHPKLLRYWIQDFKSVIVKDGNVCIELGVQIVTP